LMHTQRWHAHHRSAGSGHVYQGRFKSFPIQEDDHFYTVTRYVERNALRRASNQLSAPPGPAQKSPKRFLITFLRTINP
jgi:hypothetical protein